MRALIVLLLAVRVAHGQPSPSSPPSKTLERAIKLYDKQDFYSASVELQKVLDGETGDDAKNKQRAEFFMGKTMYQMKYYAASLAFFDRIANAQEHMYRTATIKWLIAILELPPMVSVRMYLHAFGAEEASDPTLDDKARSGFHYHHGRALADQGNLREADDELRGAVAGFETRAALARAKIAFREQRIDDAVTAIRIAAMDPALADDAVRVLATWTRLLRTPERARDALGAMAATNQLAALEYSRLQLTTALPELAGVGNDTFDTIAITTACGKVANADNGVLELRASVRELRAVVDRLLQYDDNAEIYDATEKAFVQTAALRLAILDPDIREARGWVGELDGELKELVHADKAWQTTQIAAMVLQELTVQQAVAQADTGKRYHARLELLQKDLAALWQAFDHAPSLALGPSVKSGRGIIVPSRLCTSRLAMPPRELAGPGTGPIAVTPVRGNGCAGCASGGDAGGLLLIAVALVVRRRRYRRVLGQ